VDGVARVCRPPIGTAPRCESAALLRDHGDREYLRDEVAQLIDDRVPVVALDRVERLVSLFDQMLAETRDSLLAIPGAALPKFPQHSQESREFPIGGLRSVIAHARKSNKTRPAATAV